MDESEFRDLISGKKRGLRAVLSRTALAGFSHCYASAVRARNWSYDIGLTRRHKAAVPVVSVGNITAGGTGKTPFVAFLAQWFRDREVRVGLLSRGYRAHTDQGNDEKLVLDRVCPEVPHLQNRNRVDAAHIACREFDCQLLLLDDGFQHRRLARDLDIVLIDAMNPWGFGHLLPRGLMREPASALRRANLVVLTRADQCANQQLRGIRDQIGRCALQPDCVEVAFRPRRLVNANGQSAELASLSGQRVVAFCGVGNPASFQRTLEKAAVEVATLRAFRDHHHYEAEDFTHLQIESAKHAATALLTTLKDLVKINRTHLGGCPLWAVDIETEILGGHELLKQRLEEVLLLVAQRK